MNKIYNKYLTILPKELTWEQLMELMSTIAQIEYQRRDDIKHLQEWEDTVNNVITYLMEKDAKGKKGLEYLKNNCTMPHFINILHMECRNDINYIVRKKSTQRLLYNTNSLSEPINKDDTSSKTLEDTIADYRALFSSEEGIDLDIILSCLEDKQDEAILINYSDEVESDVKLNFSYKNFAKLYYNNYVDKKLTYKDFKDLLTDNKGNQLSDDNIRDLINRFKRYLKKDRILGGEV